MIYELFEDYELWEQLIRKTRQKLADLYARKLSTTQVNDGLPRGTASYTMEDYMADKEELEADLAELLYKQSLVYDKIFGLLVSLNDLRQREVIYLRYIQLLPWKRVCSEMRLSRTRVYDIHKAALENLENICVQNIQTDI